MQFYPRGSVVLSCYAPRKGSSLAGIAGSIARRDFTTFGRIQTQGTLTMLPYTSFFAIGVAVAWFDIRVPRRVAIGSASLWIVTCATILFYNAPTSGDAFGRPPPGRHGCLQRQPADYSFLPSSPLRWRYSDCASEEFSVSIRWPAISRILCISYNYHPQMSSIAEIRGGSIYLTSKMLALARGWHTWGYSSFRF